MNGVINIYKEKGCTSFHLVYELRKLTGEPKVGHTGTLDPDVTGVLPICLGKATKLVGQLTDTDKTYKCTLLFGKTTDTQDASGNVLTEMSAEDVRARFAEILKNGNVTTSAEHGAICESAETADAAEHDEVSEPEQPLPAADPVKKLIIDTIKSFEGEISQVPPMYSALKVDGVKLVDAARRGVEIERKARPVTIHSISDILAADDYMTVDFTVHCSKGTYVRTLCEDIGAKLGVPACMLCLERTKAAGLDLSTAITIDQAKKYAEEGTLSEHIIPADRFLDIYGTMTVNDDSVKALAYGNYLFRRNLNQESAAGFKKIKDGSIFRVYDEKGTFYALYRFDGGLHCLKCVKMFRDTDE